MTTTPAPTFVTVQLDPVDFWEAAARFFAIAVVTIANPGALDLVRAEHAASYRRLVARYPTLPAVPGQQWFEEPSLTMTVEAAQQYAM